MNAIDKNLNKTLPKFVGDTAEIDPATKVPFANSRKVYIQGSRADIQVPFREISLSDTPSQFGAEKNPPVMVYDTSGVYTDPNVNVDIRSGLPAMRAAWIMERGDVEQLDGPSSAFGHQRLVDPALSEMRFNLHRKPLRAKAGANVSQMHYARKGIITPEMEYIAIRENQRREGMSEMLQKQHKGQHFGASIPQVITPEFVRSEVALGRRAP